MLLLVDMIGVVEQEPSGIVSGTPSLWRSEKLTSSQAPRRSLRLIAR